MEISGYRKIKQLGKVAFYEKSHPLTIFRKVLIDVPKYEFMLLPFIYRAQRGFINYLVFYDELNDYSLYLSIYDELAVLSVQPNNYVLFVCAVCNGRTAINKKLFDFLSNGYELTELLNFVFKNGKLL